MYRTAPQVEKTMVGGEAGYEVFNSFTSVLGNGVEPLMKTHA